MAKEEHNIRYASANEDRSDEFSSEKQRIQRIKEDTAGLSDDLQAKSKLISNIREEHDRMLILLNEEKSRNDVLTKTKTELQTQLEKEKHGVMQIKSKIQDIIEERDQLKNECKDMKEMQDRIEKENARLRKLKIDFEDLQRKKDTESKMVECLKKTQDDLREGMKAQKEKFCLLEQEKQQNKDRLNEEKSRNDVLLKTQTELKTQLEKVKHDVVQTKNRIQEISEERDKLKKECNVMKEMQERIEKENARLRKLKIDFEDLLRKKDTESKIVQCLKKTQEDLKEEIKAQQEKFCLLAEEKQQNQKKLNQRDQVETLLRSEISNMKEMGKVKQNESSKFEEIEQHRTEAEEKLKAYIRELEQWKKRAIEKQAIDKEKKLLLKAKLDGANLDLQLEKKRQGDDVKGSLHRITHEQNQTAVAKSRSRVDRDSLRSQNRTLKAKIKRLEDEKQSQLERFQVEMKRLQTVFNRESEENAKFKKRPQEEVGKFHQFIDTEKENERKYKETEKRLNQEIERLNDIIEMEKRSPQKNAELQKRMISAENEMDKLKTEIDKLEKDNTILRGQMDILKQEVDHYRERILEIRQENYSSKEENTHTEGVIRREWIYQRILMDHLQETFNRSAVICNQPRTRSEIQKYIEILKSELENAEHIQMEDDILTADVRKGGIRNLIEKFEHRIQHNNRPDDMEVTLTSPRSPIMHPLFSLQNQWTSRETLHNITAKNVTIYTAPVQNALRSQTGEMDDNGNNQLTDVE